MKQSKYQLLILALTVLAFVFALPLSIAAQDITQPATTTTTGPETHAVHQTHVTNAEVIHVSGHEIVVELENGQLELLRLPEDFKFHVDGKHLSVHELQPGTKLSQELHTVSTPQEVTTIRTVNGKVWHVSGRHVILSFPEGENKMYTAPEDLVININGEKKTVFDLRKGMDLSATVVTIASQNTITTHTVVTGQAPLTFNVPFEGPLLIEPPTQTPAPAVTATAEQPTAKELPETASLLPFAGVLGLVFLGLYAGLRMVRRNPAQGIPK
jgi:hypothetical protein